MTLTREEQKNVLRMVMESHQGVTISEAKSNEDIREEMKLNLEFYNALKEGFIEDGKATLNEAAGMFSTVLGVLGNIKDFLTGTKVIKDITAWVQGVIQKLSEKLGPKIDQFIPQKIQDLAKDGVSAVEKFVKWIYNTLSYKGLAKMFAMIRYKTIRPTDEQKQCMELAAKKVYKWILITLVIAFIIKFAMVAIPIAIKASAASSVAVTTSTVQASFATSLKPIGVILSKLGHGSLFKGALSTASAAIKTKDAKKISSDIKAKEQEAKDKEIDGFKDAWNYCPLPQKESIEFNRMTQLAGI